MSQISQYAGGSVTWVSGNTYAQFQRVIDPVDGRVFYRRTATGSGATRPALDLTNYSLQGFPPVRTTAGLVSSLALGGAAQPQIATALATLGGSVNLAQPKTVVINQWTNVLTLSSRGFVDLLMMVPAAGDGTEFIRISVDGNFIVTSGGMPSSNSFYNFIGGVVNPPAVHNLNATYFEREFKIEFLKSGGTTSAQIYGIVNYQLLS